MKNREKGRGLGQGLYDDLARLEGSVLQVERSADLAINLEAVGLEGDALLVLLALGQFQLCDSFRGCHVRNLNNLISNQKMEKR